MAWVASGSDIVGAGPGRPRTRRIAALLVLALGVLLLHALALGRWRAAAPGHDPGTRPRTPVLVLNPSLPTAAAAVRPATGFTPQTTTTAPGLPPAGPAPTVRSPPRPTAAAQALLTPAAAGRLAAAPASREGLPPAAPTPPDPTAQPRPSEPTPTAPPTTAASDVVAAPQSAPDAGAAGQALPIYATRLPPAGRWTYQLKRGERLGTAEWMWGRDGDRYATALTGRIDGTTVLDWTSHGEVDAAGVAPSRFLARRRGRDAVATNFQRDRGLISWSGSAASAPLAGGAQDRLSWWLQLRAVLAAAPAAPAPGTRIVLQVAGVRGEADVWSIEVVGLQTLQRASGPVDALHLRREPARPYDIAVEAWLDPARDHLPLRIRMSPGADGASALELELTEP